MKKYVDDCINYYEYTSLKKQRFIWKIYFCLCIYAFTITMVLLGFIFHGGSICQ